MSSIEKINLQDLCKWSDPKRVNTRNGDRDLMTADPTPEFSKLWKANKESLREQGIGWTKDRETGEWKVCWWRPIPKEEADVREQSYEMSRMTDADGTFPVPDGLDYFGYQKAFIRYARDRESILLGDQMGLGKTIQALGVINDDPTIEKVIIICPATLKSNWVRECRKWLVRSLMVGKAQGKNIPHNADILVINFDILSKNLKALQAIKWDLRIVDEAHYIKNGKAQRTKAVKAIKARRKISMTGTPIVNRPKELFEILNDLDPVTWPKFWRFGMRYCGAKQVSIGYGRCAWDFSGASNLDELNRILREKVMVRRLKSQVLKDLPKKLRTVIEMECPPEIKEILADEKRQWEEKQAAIRQAEMDKREADLSDDPEKFDEAVTALRNAQKVAFEEMSKVRHQMALAKLPLCLPMIEEILEAEEKVIVFCHHRDVYDAIRKLYPKFVGIVGGLSDEQKQSAVDAFQEDPNVTGIVGTIGAMAEGLTLTAASNVVFIELDWVPGKNSQCEDRAHRIGQESTVNVYHLVLEGSLDAHIAKTCVRKQKVMDQAMDKHVTQAEAEVKETLDLTIPDVEIPKFNKEQLAAIRTGLQQLDAMCDGAAAIDGCGFNKIDTRFGKKLSRWSGEYTNKQAAYGALLVNKYRRQLDPDLVAKATEHFNREDS